MDAEDARELAKQAKAGDEEAKKKLTEASLRLVVSVAKGYTDRSLELSELVKAGQVGLLVAERKFKPVESRESSDYANFSDYATAWIRQEILKAIATRAKDHT